jgi:broad specificity phosphatase PhoE
MTEEQVPPLNPTTLVIVRHAETEANASQLWQGDLDAPLTPRGVEQVTATAFHLGQMHAQTPIDYFYVSPLARTH